MHGYSPLSPDAWLLSTITRCMTNLNTNTRCMTNLHYHQVHDYSPLSPGAWLISHGFSPIIQIIQYKKTPIQNNIWNQFLTDSRPTQSEFIHYVLKMNQFWCNLQYILNWFMSRFIIVSESFVKLAVYPIFIQVSDSITLYQYIWSYRF